jgi:IclR family acetate operon transcriptional repressor
VDVSRSHERIFDVIAALRDAHRPLSLTEVARAAQLAPSSTHSMLSALLSRQVAVINADKKYSLGPALFHYGTSYAKQTGLYRSTWRGVVSLAHEYGMAAALSVPWEAHHLVLAVHDEPDAAVRLGIGSRIPLDAGSYGKIYFAYAGVAGPAVLTRYTASTSTEPVRFGAELEVVRRRGYALDEGEYVADVRAVAAAVTSSDGYEGLVALMSSSSSGQSRDLTEIGERLALFCARASAILGDSRREPAYGDVF